MAAEKIRLCLNNRKPKRLLNRKREKGVLEVDLITLGWEKKIKEEGPLARRMRPDNLTQFVGQEKIFGPGKPLRKIVESDQLVSLLFYGPPGTGKTSLAKIITSVTKADFVQLNAVAAGVKEVRSVIDEARDNWSLHDKRTILFIDEIHRFNKAQQDVLLSAVEQGTVIFIGATTENPFFYLTAPLLSRLRLFHFEPLQKNEIITLMKEALADPDRGLGKIKIKIDPEALEYFADKANGDARAALNALEMAALIGEDEEDSIRITTDTAAKAMQKRLIRYDRDGDSHFDMASAFIKSIRGSDPDAALYWMARMLNGGEDPLFIARRLIISASEDIGNADPHALPLAVAAAQAVQMIGLPEGRIPLAQAATYLASVPKSNAAYLALEEALKMVEEEENRSVPDHLKDSSYRSAKKMGYGADYRYPHDYPGHYTDQEYLPPALVGRRFYRPADQGQEGKLQRYLENLNRADHEKEENPSKE
ncbi:MAG TPA: replication-associated recombination protein A [Firmicutes bacterium]|nr:replication-associated recombination protein A [Bacillota bacterium]